MDSSTTVVLILILATSVKSHNFPEYYDGRFFTFINGTSQRSTPFKSFSSNKEYNKKDSPEDDSIVNILTNPSRAIPPNVYNPSNTPPPNKTGTFHKVTFKKGIISYLEVLDNFDFDGNKTVPVRLCTSWYTFDPAESINHVPGMLTKAVDAGHIMNMTMFFDYIPFTKNETEHFNAGTEWEIDEYLCYYEGSSAKINALGKCVIPYIEIIAHYLSLWSVDSIPIAVNGERVRVSNDLEAVMNYDCGISDKPNKLASCRNSSYEAIYYVDSKEQLLIEKDDTLWYRFDTKPTGLGHAVNTSYGYNRFKKTYDLNMTILFNDWTFDMPSGLLNNYRDFTIRYENMYMIVHYWVEDDPPPEERDIPESFWVMAVIMIAPTIVLVLALCILAFTCSKRSFDLRLWEFKNDQKKIGSVKEAKRRQVEKAIERHEERRREELREEGHDV